MARSNTSSLEGPFYNESQAKWVVCVLTMLIAVVGKESLVGLLLRQTRAEINGLLRVPADEATAARAANYQQN